MAGDGRLCHLRSLGRRSEQLKIGVEDIIVLACSVEKGREVILDGVKGMWRGKEEVPP